MKSVSRFIVKPYNSLYNNVKKIGDNSLLLNTSIESFRHVSKEALVLATPTINPDSPIKVGDIVMIHHNIFRSYYDIKGKEKKSSTYFKDDMYLVSPDQIYAYKSFDKWCAHLDYCFVKPIVETSNLKTQKEQKHIGILKIGNSSLNELKISPGDLVGFKPFGEFEFIIDDERLYCMKSNDIVIKYERKGNEKEYNPSWAKSS